MAVVSRSGTPPWSRSASCVRHGILRIGSAMATGTWSLATLQRALRQAPDGLPTVSTATIWTLLHDAGFAWQRDRSWCEPGASVRKRKGGTVTVHDPDAVAKKT